MSALPSRRDENWRWSDLRAVVSADAPQGAGSHPIERLADGLGRARTIEVADGEDHLLVSLMEPAAYEAEALDASVAPGGSLTRLVFQRGGGVALSFLRVRLAAGATFRQFVLSEGGRLARIETEAVIEGENASVELYGMYLAGAGRHADLTSRIIHRAAHGSTVQFIKGAARRAGRGVFQGKIEVAKGAQRTDARQSHHALLLEEGAEIDAKPDLEIWADDVQCAHGNTVGGLSLDQLFYLRSRGVPELEARALLTEAFLAEAIPPWLSGEHQEEALNRLRSWLGGAP